MIEVIHPTNAACYLTTDSIDVAVIFWKFIGGSLPPHHFYELMIGLNHDFAQLAMKLIVVCSGQPS